MVVSITKHKSLLKSIGYFFAIVWFGFIIFKGLGGMLAGVACRMDRYQGEQKLRFCDSAILLDSLGFFTERARADGSIFHLERGVALVQVGRKEEAREAFERAVRDADAYNRYRLIERMKELDDWDARSMFHSIVYRNYP